MQLWRVLSIVLPLLILLISGCQTALDGNWVGQLDCENWEPIDFDFTVHNRSGVAVGEGKVREIYFDWEPADAEFEIEIYRTANSGAQDLDIKMENCEVYYADDHDGVDCGKVEKEQWDGQNLIVARIDDLLETGERCDLEVQR